MKLKRVAFRDTVFVCGKSAETIDITRSDYRAWDIELDEARTEIVFRGNKSVTMVPYQGNVKSVDPVADAGPALHGAVGRVMTAPLPSVETIREATAVAIARERGTITVVDAEAFRAKAGDATMALGGGGAPVTVARKKPGPKPKAKPEP